MRGLINETYSLSRTRTQRGYLALLLALVAAIALGFQFHKDDWYRKGAHFLQQNAKRSGVVTLDSGLQYLVLREGTGKTPKAGNWVTIHCRAHLIDGREFDNTYEREEVETIPVSRVVAGLTEALQLMQEGSRWELYIPPELGFGNWSVGSDIPANSVLIYDLELLSVE